MKNYIGISLDTSASMRGITRAAGNDYNENIEGIKEEAEKHKIDTIVSVVKCGVGRKATIEREVVNSSVNAIKPIPDGMYKADGMATPLFDSIGELISIMENVPDKDDPGVSFLIMAITDGEENNSKKWNARTLSEKIRRLQATDRWSFIFRVPKGNKKELIKIGIPEGNILEWETTERGMKESSVQTRAGFSNYYSARSTGKTSTTKFYTNLNDVDISKVKRTLVDVSNQVTIHRVKTVDHGIQIRDYVEQKLKKVYIRGSVFYQLTKTEKVQEYKEIAIRDRIKGHVYTGASARDLLGLPEYGEIKLVPGSHGQYDVFIQSTSVNRKLVADTDVLIINN